MRSLLIQAIGKLLDKLEPWAETQPYDSEAASLIRLTRRNYDQLVKVPAQLIAELSEHGAAAYQTWAKARPENDFATIRPYLEKTLDYSRQIANCFPGYDHIADPLIDFADLGMKAESVRAIFADLRAQLVPIVQAITEQEPADDSCLHQILPRSRPAGLWLANCPRLRLRHKSGAARQNPSPLHDQIFFGRCAYYHPR